MSRWVDEQESKPPWTEYKTLRRPWTCFQQLPMNAQQRTVYTSWVRGDSKHWIDAQPKVRAKSKSWPDRMKNSNNDTSVPWKEGRPIFRQATPWQGVSTVGDIISSWLRHLTCSSSWNYISIRVAGGIVPTTFAASILSFFRVDHPITADWLHTGNSQNWMQTRIDDFDGAGGLCKGNFTTNADVIDNMISESSQRITHQVQPQKRTNTAWSIVCRGWGWKRTPLWSLLPLLSVLLYQKLTSKTIYAANIFYPNRERFIKPFAVLRVARFEQSSEARTFTIPTFCSKHLLVRVPKIRTHMPLHCTILLDRFHWCNGSRNASCMVYHPSLHFDASRPSSFPLRWRSISGKHTACLEALHGDKWIFASARYNTSACLCRLKPFSVKACNNSKQRIA